MKKLSILLFILVSSISSGQQNDFDELLDLFEEHKKSIPQELASKYFNFKPDKRFGDLLTDKVVLKTDNFIALSTHLDCFAGGMCQSSTLTTFDLNGNRISETAFESEMADCSFQSSRELIFKSEDLIVIKNIEIEEDCSGETDFRKEELILEFKSLDSIGNFGYSKYQKIDLRRDHPYSSFKLFSKKDLQLMKKENLPIIRNEIFAAYGYEFKSKKWQDFFSKKVWYKPISNDVTDKLSIIEKRNVELITELEKK
ncbi:YARHG domain-containing protein [Aquimarina brevivitae]|uniref:YARHG domain-containing protein n=1 Tax=Aquimarina brevivitae TaxID=323412 RepID=A0A4V2F5J7_9FLAO|nr:YARHG domain-containing protein [Aquimarina brevivitae]RZS93059.1 YARHG domain-containing protein [Aquimarina brevivitae]